MGAILLAVLAVLFFCTAADLHAQNPWPTPMITLHRGPFAHTIVNLGMTGRRDQATKPTKQYAHSFSYPQGRRAPWYSGGIAREAWYKREYSGGEGIWILSRTAGVARVTTAGSRTITPDVVGLPHDVSGYPEAPLGRSEHHAYPLSLRDRNGNRASRNGNDEVWGARTNYWPARGDVGEKTPRIGEPVVIWNYRFDAYKDGRAFVDRSEGFGGRLNPPA